MQWRCVCAARGISGLGAPESVFSELLAAVSPVIWNRHCDLPSPVPWCQQPREPVSSRGFELGWGSALFLFDFQNWSIWAEQHRCEVPQLIASAGLMLTEPLVIQTVNDSCSSEAWNWKCVLVKP